MNTISAQDLLTQLQGMLTDFQKELARFGKNDEDVLTKFDEMIAFKEIVESIIQMPVNPQTDGQVTVGV